MEHVFDNICTELEYKADPLAFNQKMHDLGPTFIGQGCCKSVGSDCYAKYIVEKKVIGKKTIWGIASAKSHFEHDWTDGDMICDGPVSWKAEEWIVAWGKTKTGKAKWWFCDKEGNRYKGLYKIKCTYGFGGAFSRRDPSW